MGTSRKSVFNCVTTDRKRTAFPSIVGNLLRLMFSVLSEEKGDHEMELPLEGTKESKCSITGWVILRILVLTAPL